MIFSLATKKLSGSELVCEKLKNFQKRKMRFFTKYFSEGDSHVR